MKKSYENVSGICSSDMGYVLCVSHDHDHISLFIYLIAFENKFASESFFLQIVFN